MMFRCLEVGLLVCHINMLKSSATSNQFPIHFQAALVVLPRILIIYGFSFLVPSATNLQPSGLESIDVVWECPLRFDRSAWLNVRFTYV